MISVWRSSTDHNTDYELVRIYHPDSPVCRGLPAETTQARFHAIKAAYDALRGKTPFSATGEAIPPKKDYHDLSTAMWRAKQRRRAELNIGIDDKWKDRLMLGVLSLVRLGVFTLRSTTNMYPSEDIGNICRSSVLHKDQGSCGGTRRPIQQV